jgi:hypothetical protein
MGTDWRDAHLDGVRTAATGRSKRPKCRFDRLDNGVKTHGRLHRRQGWPRGAGGTRAGAVHRPDARPSVSGRAGRWISGGCATLTSALGAGQRASQNRTGGDTHSGGGARARRGMRRAGGHPVHDPSSSSSKPTVLVSGTSVRSHPWARRHPRRSSLALLSAGSLAIRSRDSPAGEIPARLMGPPAFRVLAVEVLAAGAVLHPDGTRRPGACQ